MSSPKWWNKLVDLIEKYFSKKTSSMPKPTLPADKPVTGEQTPAVDISGKVVDPAGYTEAGVAANAHYEECHIEPATGLMVRVPVWRPSVGNWWMLSSLFEGRVKRIGSELVVENFVKNGQAIEVIGFTDYEIHSNENPDTVRYLVKGNRCPYTGARRYVVSRCHELK